MADWSLPTLPSLYADFLNYLKARDIDAGTLYVADPVNPVNGAIRYLRASNKFQEYSTVNGWIDKVISVAGGGTGSNTSGGAIGNLGLGTMAQQNANNVAISGGVINGLSSLVSNGAATTGPLTVNGNVNPTGSVDAAQDVLARRNFFVGGTSRFVGNVQVDVLLNVGSISANTTINAGGDINAGGIVYAQGNIGGKGQIFMGPASRQITEVDGSVRVAAIAPASYGGAGTKVLTDNGVWTDNVLIGGGVREVVHQNMSFGTDEFDRTIVIPWTGAQPSAANKWHLQFDQPYQDQSSTNGGTVFYSVTYTGPNTANIHRTLGPGAVPPILAASVVYTAFHHRTEV